ncbi:MAG TPA: glycosyltransferase family 9 protein [Burkholderiales bacterium]
MARTTALEARDAIASMRRRFERAPERIAVFRALHFGDLLCAVPALRALRAAFPRARVTLVGLPWAEEFARRFNRYVDDFLPFPGGQGLPERDATEAETEAYQRAARVRRFDLALQLHGDGRHANAIVAAMGARRVAGFHPAGAGNPEPDWFLPYPEAEPEVRRLLRLLEFLGVPGQGEELEFPIAPDEWRTAAALRLRFGLQPGQYACVHPGGRAPARRWRIERFAHVADRLAARGLRIVLTGTRDEAPITEAVKRAMLGSCVDSAGEARGGTLAALLAGARLLVCNDTGISHVAAALRVPSVVIFTGSSPARWAPADGARHRAVVHEVACRPCAHWRCPIGQPCAEQVGVEAVMQEATALLSAGT